MTEARFSPRPLITSGLSSTPFYCLPQSPQRSFLRATNRLIHAEGWPDTERRAQRQDLTHVWALLYTPWAGHELPFLDSVSGSLVHPTWLMKVYPRPSPIPILTLRFSGAWDHLRHIPTSHPFCPFPSFRALHCKTGTMQNCSSHTLKLGLFSEARGVLSTERRGQHLLEQPRPTISLIRLGPNPPTGLTAMDCETLRCHGLGCPSLDVSA